MENNYENEPQVVVVEKRRRVNVFGLIGFIFSILTFFSSWIPVAGWLLWIVGLVLSTIGLFRTPRELAVAGFLISMISIFALIFLAGLALTFFTTVISSLASLFETCPL